VIVTARLALCATSVQQTRPSQGAQVLVKRNRTIAAISRQTILSIFKRTLLLTPHTMPARVIAITMMSAPVIWFANSAVALTQYLDATALEEKELTIADTLILKLPQ